MADVLDRHPSVEAVADEFLFAGFLIFIVI